MADVILVTLLIWHIISMVSWLGGGALFVSVISPGLRKVSQGARAETLVSVLPGYSKYIAASSGSTILAGVSLYGYSFANQKSSFSSPFGSGTAYIDAGALAGLIAFVIVMAVIVPAARKIVNVCKQQVLGTQTADNNVAPVLIRRMRMGANLAVGALALALVLMIIGASV